MLHQCGFSEGSVIFDLVMYSKNGHNLNYAEKVQAAYLAWSIFTGATAVGGGPQAAAADFTVVGVPQFFESASPDDPPEVAPGKYCMLLCNSTWSQTRR